MKASDLFNKIRLPVTIIVFVLFAFLCYRSEASEPSPFIPNTPLPTKEAEAPKVTTGYIDNKPIRLKTRETATQTVTTGWVDGKYVRIKEKKPPKGEDE